MHRRVETVLTGLLVMAAVVVSVSAAKTAFFSSPRKTIPVPTYVQHWTDLMPFARPVGGNATAPIKIIAFVDLECPGCAAFHKTLTALLNERTDIQALYVQFPLPYHRFAMPAARAAECALEEGRFGEWVSAVFESRDSLGLKSWGTIAQAAGIRDTTRIADCAAGTGNLGQIDSAKALGELVEIDATPTVLINGWRMPGTPSKAAVDSVLKVLDTSPNRRRS